MTPLTDQGTEASRPRPDPGLAYLVHPVDPGTFQTEYWETKPLVVHRNDPDYYAGVLSLDDVDRVLSLSNSSLDNIRVVMDDTEIPVSDLRLSGGDGSANALEAIFERYRTGATIVLKALNGRWEPLARLSRALGAELSTRIQADVYVVPALAREFAPRYESHDVFIMQVYGTQHWRLTSQPHALPVQGQSYDESQPEPVADQEFHLECGDLLHLPRGTVHSATANSVVSVHVTLRIDPVLSA